MSYYKPGIVNGDIILKLESTIEQLKQERRTYEKQYHDLIFTNEKLNSELESLKKVYNDLAESHAKQVIEIGELNKEKDALELAWFNKNTEVESELSEISLLHQVANSSVDILSGKKTDLESKVKELTDKNDYDEKCHESKLVHYEGLFHDLQQRISSKESELLKAKEHLTNILDFVNEHTMITWVNQRIELANEFLNKKP